MPHKDREEYNRYQREYQRRRRAEFSGRLQVMKTEMGCSHCEENDWRCLDWHHTDPSTKEASISDVVSRGTWGWDRILRELEKCILLCANCHRKEEFALLGK